MSSDPVSPRFYIGAYGICRDPDDRLLLARMSSGIDDGRWTMPGGGIQWGEHPDAALLRELEEETGIVDIKAFNIIQVYSHLYPNIEEYALKPLHNLGVVYNVTLGSYDLRFELYGMTDRCEWFTEDQARWLPLTPAGDFAVEMVWPKTK